jgi:heptosyltransferase-1
MRIAIVKLSALGDIVHAMIVLQLIKKFDKKIKIDWIVERTYKELLDFHPDINQVHTINIKKVNKKKLLVNFFKDLKKIRAIPPYDLVIDMQGLIKSAIISKLIPSSHTLGFDRYSAREGLASFFYSRTFNCPYEKNVIERNVEIIGHALATSFDLSEINRKIPFIFTNEQKITIPHVNSKKNILLVPGASHDSKRYPIEKLAEVSKKIDANFFVIWGTHEEQVLAKKIQIICPNIHVFEKLKLSSLILLISRFDLVIGPDTGPTHIAWGLNIPSITLFGSTPGYRNTFETQVNKVIESDSKVNPKKIDKGDYSIKNIDVEKIVLVIKELLTKIN